MSNVSPHVFPTYDFSLPMFVRGEGAYVYTEEGNRYIDLTSGIGVTCMGHSHPALVATLQEQSTQLWHLSNLFTDGRQERVAARLCEHSHAEQVFFCNSGSEAIEASIKLARRYFQQRGQSERYRIVAARHSFHGRTMTAIAASGQKKLTDGFAPLPSGFDHITFGVLEEADRALTAHTAAVLIEPIQGEGGIHVADDVYLQGLATLCQQRGCLLIVDEVQCGMGRSGKLFAHQWSAIKPNIIAMAKGLGGGFPVGACLADKQTAQGFTKGSHGSTFGGNPLAMAVADKVLELLFAKDFLPTMMGNAKKLHDGLTQLCQTYPQILHPWRGKGLMIGLPCVIGNHHVIEAFHQNNVLAVPAGCNVVRLLPPLTITAEVIAESLTAMDKACAQLARDNQHLKQSNKHSGA
ncbi:MAG: aspartate aminotransferase family protein [Alphaproteobacteria bacterium GM202ARS2]|nr:aspartate aminotransferase family protein [Alphaproteobacteria bacterium GM202ARS2]